MTGPTALGVMDPPADWVVCFTCRGARWLPDCLAARDADCPHIPPCRHRHCGTCGGDGGWRRSDLRGAAP